MTASRDRSRRRQRLPPSAAESIWSHSSPSAPRDRPTRADTGAAGQPPSAVKTARPARAETGAASQLPSAAKTARRTRPPSAAKIDRCSPAAVRREDCSPYASSVRREDRPPYAASRSPSTARRSRSTERPPYAAKTGLCAPIAVRRETGVRTRETGRHAPSSTAPSSSAVRVRSCPREPCPEHQGGEYCTHITDIRMSLCTIARRLCLSKPSSGRRLSVVWGHLYSTEVASEKVVDLADRIAALPPEEIKQIAPALLFRLNQVPPQVISGQGFSFGAQGGSGAAAGKAEEKKAEKTVFDVKLEKFDAAAKIKIIKEIRTFTDLGLKEAKELVEKAPVILKQSLTKEEAEAIIGKIKAAGGVAVME